MLLSRGLGVLQPLLTPPGVHSAFTEHMIAERGLDGSLDSLGVRVVLHPVHKRHMRRFAKAQVDDGFYIEIVFIPAHPPRAWLVGSIERAWKLITVREIGPQETVVDEPVVEPVFEGGGEGGHGGIAVTVYFSAKRLDARCVDYRQLLKITFSGASESFL